MSKGAIFETGNTKYFEHFVNYVLKGLGGLNASDIDLTSAAAIDTQWGFEYGFYVQSGYNMKTIIDVAMVGHCGYYYQNNDGKIVFDYLREPDLTADYVADKDHPDKYGIESIDKDLDRAPGLSDAVATRKNWHVFSYDDVKNDGALSSEEKQQVSSEFVFYHRSAVTTAGNDTFHDTYKHARNGCHVPTACANESAGPDRVAHLEVIYAVIRHFYDLVIIADNILDLLEIELGKTLQIIHPRWGLESGKNTRIIKISGRSLLDPKITVRAWG